MVRTWSSTYYSSSLTPLIAPPPLPPSPQYDRAFALAEVALASDKQGPASATLALQQYAEAIRAFQEVSRRETNLAKRRLVGTKVKEFMESMRRIQGAGCACGGGSGSGQPAFIPAPGFQGARPGYEFKRGDSGLGYYLSRVG